MKTYLVSHIETLNDEKFTDLMMSMPDWFHYTTGTWIIKTKQTVDLLVDLIKASLGKRAMFFVVNIRKTNYFYGWMPKDSWKWLKK